MKTDVTTNNELKLSSDKNNWGAVLNSALGPNKRIVAKKDVDLNAADPWSTGTVFRDVAVTGPLVMEGGKVVDLGEIFGTSVSVAAALNTPTLVRLTGNNRYVELTLGLPGSGAELIADGPYTANNGFGLKADFALSGPVFQRSGLGPAAPELDADAPAFLRIWDWTSGSGVIVDTKPINVRKLDIVADHPAIAAELGDVRKTIMQDGIVFGTGGDCFKFAATMLAIHSGLNMDNAAKPVYQVQVRAVPWNRWSTFPYRGAFDIANDTLAPNAFKAEILRADGTSLHIFELYSTQTGGNGTGKPINHAQQSRYWTTEAPLQPSWTCHMTLRWDSARIKPSTKVQHYLPVMDSLSLHGSNVTAFDSAPEQWPMVTDNYLANGLGMHRVSPKWSRKRGEYFDTNIFDPDLNYGQMSRDDYITQAIGYGYEPGATCHHTWFMSPGGSRHDRALWPDLVTRWVALPNGTRAHGNVPNFELVRQYNFGYANEGCHYFTDVVAGKSIPKDKLKRGNICYNDTYYNGGNEDFTTDLPNSAIRLLTMGNAHHGNMMVDKNGRVFTGQYQRDNQHNYSNSAVGGYLLNDPMSMLEAKQFFDSGIAANWGFSSGPFNPGEFLTRQFAWHMGQFANTWMVTTNDETTMSRAELEAMWLDFLSRVHDAIMPGYIAQSAPTFRYLKKLGSTLNGEWFMINNEWHMKRELATDPKAFYLGLVLVLMKQSGSWASLRAKSVKAQEILDLMVVSLAKQSVDCFLDGGGRIDNRNYLQWWADPFPVSDTSVAPPADGWASYVPTKGLTDWIRLEDGSVRGNGYIEGDGLNTQHFRAQYVHILKNFFPEFNFPRVDAAISKVQEWYDLVENDPNLQWHWRFSYMGFPQAPAKLGAP